MQNIVIIISMFDHQMKQEIKTNCEYAEAHH